jgi:hypothetical protein
MGLFTKKSRQETRSILPSKKKPRHIFIKKVASSGSTDDDSLSYDKKRTSSNRKQPKAKFSRLNDDVDETTVEYIPPPGFIPFPADAFDVKHEPQVCKEVKSSDSQSETSQTVKHTLSENSSSSHEYEPPVFPIHPPKKATFSILSSPQPVESTKPLKNLSTFKANFSSTSMIGDKFDSQSRKSNELYFTNNASISRSSDSGFPTSLGGQDFQQIVFDDQFQKIEKVAVAKSDVEGSDFSDFVLAASQLATMFSPDKNASAKASQEYQAMPTSKTKLSSHTSSAVCRPAATESHKEHTFVAPSSVPLRRMKTSTNAASNDWLRYKTVEESLQQRSCVDGGFSVSSYNSNGTTTAAKSRQEFQEAIRSKPRTPLQMRTEALHARRPKRVDFCNDQSSVAETSNISLANATFSNPSTASTGSNERKAFDADLDNDDPFHVGETATSSWNENDDFAAWDTSNNPFEHVKASKQDGVAKSVANQGRIVPTVSMDDGLIASIRRSATKHSSSSKDPDGESLKRDPSPRGDIRSISSDSRLDYNQTGFVANNKRISSNSIGPQKTPPKAVTANAILGSMLFRLCDQSQSQAPMTISEGMEHHHRSIKQKSTATVSKSSPKSSSSKPMVKYGHGVEDWSGGGNASCKVPRELHAEEGSDVSSVTEEASSFYQKNFVNSSNTSSSQWSKQAHQVLNHYNVKRTLQLRDENARARFTRIHHPPHSTTPPLSRLEEDHANMFQCEM